MPDEKAGQDTGGGEADDTSAAGDPRGLPRITPVTIILVIVFILSAIALLGVMNLQVVRDYFEGETAFWILRVGLLVMIATIIVYFVLRERSNFKYTEKLLSEMTEANKRLKLLLQAERDIGSNLELEVALEHTLRYAFEVTGADFGAIYLWDKNDNALKLAMTRGVDSQKIKEPRIPVGEGLVGKAAAERRMLVVDDASSLVEGDNAFDGAAVPASQAVVPLVAGERFVGALVTGCERPHPHTDAEKRMLLGLAELATLSVKNAELYRIASRSLKAAAHQRELTGLVLDEMVAGVVTADNRGRISIFNREAQRLTGYTLEEISAMPLRPGSRLEDSPLGALVQGMLEVFGSPSEVKEGGALIMKKDGTLLPVSYRANPIVEGSEVIGATVVFMEEQGASREPEHGEGVDHQLLLRSLGSRIERLYTHPLSRVIERARSMDIEAWTRSRDDIVRTLDAGSRALAGLLEDVEHYLNCITSREWDSPGEYDVGVMVAEVVDDVLRMPEVEGVIVAVELVGLPPALGHERMIRLALEKVIENACIAASEGDKTVEVRGFVSDGILRVEVSDTGPGVPPDSREFVFHPFYTSREGRSGLGLSITSRVMKRLGGRAGIDESERGARFFLEFPISPRPDGATAGADGTEDA